jgi:phage terminase large subunit-like protein
MAEDPRKIAAALAEIERRKREYALDFYAPYPKQAEFHDLGATKRERLLMAANRFGKTFSGAAEMAIHLTGLYPDDWLGRRFDRPINAWAGSDTGLTTRDIVQTALFGPYDDKGKWGTGTVPKHCVNFETDMSLARGVTDLFDTVSVQHFDKHGKPDGKSSIGLKSFDQGRRKWQGTAKDVVWLDEECDMDIYGEALARIAPTRATDKSGMIYMTFTPLNGMSDVVLRFLNDKSPDRSVTNATIEDALHISPEEREKIVAGYADYEREARAKGIPVLGSGRIFPYTEASLSCEPFRVPAHWALIWGIDPGLDHPFAAVLLAWDKDTDVLYVMHTIKMQGALPLQHAEAMKKWGDGTGAKIPVAWPQDAHQRREFDGQLTPLRAIYKKHGLAMLDHHATFVDGSNSTELGLLDMQERMTTGRFKVFSILNEWWEEYRLYHRKDGQIVKLRDDLMSATRVAVMARRNARQALYDMFRDNREQQIARDVDFDLFA